MRCSSLRVGELQGSNPYLTDKSAWVVDFDDEVYTHSLSQFILEALMRKKRKYVRRNKVDVLPMPDALRVAEHRTINTVGQESSSTPRPRLWPDVVFQRVESIYSDGSRKVEERTQPFNLNPS